MTQPEIRKKRLFQIFSIVPGKGEWSESVKVYLGTHGARFVGRYPLPQDTDGYIGVEGFVDEESDAKRIARGLKGKFGSDYSGFVETHFEDFSHYERWMKEEYGPSVRLEN